MKLKVMNFNICCGDDPGGNTIAERAPRVEKIVRKYASDIIGLQEYTPVWKPYIERIIGDEYEIFNKYRAESSLESTPILWKKEKFECLKKGYFCPRGGTSCMIVSEYASMSFCAIKKKGYALRI